MAEKKIKKITKSTKSTKAVVKKTTIKSSKPVAKKEVKKVSKTTVVAKKVETDKSVRQVFDRESQTESAQDNKVEAGLKIDLYTRTGEKSGKFSLPENLFGEKVNKVLLSQAVRVYLANQRQGTASTKTRGEVSYSTRKIYRQKGTGRARHGGVGAPIFVHGGVAHGPKPKNFGLTMPERMRKKALISALSAKAADAEIRVVTGLKEIEPKTKLVAAMLKNIGLENKKVMFVLSEKLENVSKAARNIDRVTLDLAGKLNAYEVLNSGVLVFMKEAIEAMEKSVKKEEKL